MLFKSETGELKDAIPSRQSVRRMRSLKCERCAGHAHARGFCVVCREPLCKKHMCVGGDGAVYCKDHRPGFTA